MPRAHRCFVPGCVWHITHRCHQREFLLKFARDRRRWLHWLFEAKKRYGLCMLNYAATSNHVHLLVLDRGKGEIARAMQLAAGRTGQEYNRRKGRKGAFWEDRYHAAAVDTEHYLARCLVYIDLNMVRAGVVDHPAQWGECGYQEILQPPCRYGITDMSALTGLLGFNACSEMQQARATWIEQALRGKTLHREAYWSESLAVGGPAFVESVKVKLGIGARYRTVQCDRDVHYLKDAAADYLLETDT